MLQLKALYSSHTPSPIQVGGHVFEGQFGQLSGGGAGEGGGLGLPGGDGGRGGGDGGAGGDGGGRLHASYGLFPSASRPPATVPSARMQCASLSTQKPLVHPEPEVDPCAQVLLHAHGVQ